MGNSSTPLEEPTQRYTQEDILGLIDSLGDTCSKIALDKLRKKINKPLKKTKQLEAIYDLLPLEGSRINSSHKTARYKDVMVTLSSHGADAKPEAVQDCYDTVGRILQKFATQPPL